MRENVERYVAGLPGWAIAFAVVLAAIAGASIVHVVAQRILSRVVPAGSPWRHFVDRTRYLALALLLLLAVNLSAQLPAIPEEIGVRAAQFLSAAAFFVLGWAAMIGSDIAARFYLRRFNLDAADNLPARKQVTQVRVLLRTVQVLIVLVTLAAGLMTFDTVRSFGVSLFASAGVAGLAVGLAARPLLANLIAGVQLAMTQPIRLDDAVVVENEWGWIEEITATYVVIKLWDLRRLIVPLSYFMEKPFQNWTRHSASIVGTVTVHADYTVPVEAVRKKLREIVEQSKLWDKDVVNLQVTEATERTVQLRMLVSAATSPQAWDLRCEVREKIIAFLQAEHPECLPRRRQEAVDYAAKLRST